MTFVDDERGLALGIVAFFGILIVAALLYLLMDAGMATVFDVSSSNAESADATDQINLADAIWNNLLYFVLFLGAVFLIARAVREGSRV